MFVLGSWSVGFRELGGVERRLEQWTNRTVCFLRLLGCLGLFLFGRKEGVAVLCVQWKCGGDMGV